MSAKVHDFLDETVEKVENVNGFMLITLALMILVFTGIFANEGVSYGFSTNNPTYTGYPCYTSDPIGNATCNAVSPLQSNPNANALCATTPTHCEVNQTLSILSSNSPFTYLLNGNFIGFVNSFFTNSTQSAIVTQNLNGKNITFSNYYVNGTAFGCKSTTNSSNNYIWNCGSQNPAYSFDLNITVNAVVQFHSSNNYYISPVVIIDKASNQYTASCQMSVALATYQYITCFNISASFSINTNSLIAVLGFIGGLILALLSLGLYIQGEFLASGGAAGVNSQGTKMAQIIGIGLLVWSFIYSEFSTGLLDLNGVMANAGTSAVLLVGVVFFFGLWRTI